MISIGDENINDFGSIVGIRKSSIVTVISIAAKRGSSPLVRSGVAVYLRIRS